LSQPTIHKFGGSCLATSDDIEAVVERIRKAGEATVVVVSAFNGVTDRILEQADHGSLNRVPAFVASIEIEHLEKVPEIQQSPWAIRFADTLHHLAECLSKHLTETDESLRVESLACGEKLSSIAIAAALDARGIPAQPAWSEEVGIYLNDSGESAGFDIQKTKERLSIPMGATPVITGWYGTHDGRLGLMGRGGSDLSATSLAAILDAEEVTIWRDVPGILTLAPRWSLPSRNLPYLSYTEVSELALFSEPMLHPSAVDPLRSAGIPLRLRPLHDPSAEGSIIGPEVSTTEVAVRAVGCVSSLTPITWRLSSVLSLAHPVIDATSVLERARIRIWSLGATPGMVRLLVHSRSAHRANRLLNERPGLPTAEVGEPVSLLCFVGEGIGRDQRVNTELNSAATTSGISLRILSDVPREHAIHATVPFHQTELALVEFAEALNLLTP
jgi:aspartate kinase/aspartokinase/homoserine dehydrogenase 1